MMYNTDMMGVYHEDEEHPPSTKENTPNPDSEPPTTKENRESLQSASADRLPNRSVRSGNARCWQLVFICHSVGSKPYLGYHNSTNLY